MLAFAFYLLEQADADPTVFVYPDGEHAKQFDIIAFLKEGGFHRAEGVGTTAYGGRYVRGHQTIVVHPKSGQGDVVGTLGAQRIVGECKGGTINSSHAGHKSRLRKGLSELIGQLMMLAETGDRQVAVLPYTPEIDRLAERLAPRCRRAGIEVALVDQAGKVRFIGTQ